jgi:hypothetical protein
MKFRAYWAEKCAYLVPGLGVACLPDTVGDIGITLGG